MHTQNFYEETMETYRHKLRLYQINSMITSHLTAKLYLRISTSQIVLYFYELFSHSVLWCFGPLSGQASPSSTAVLRQLSCYKVRMLVFVYFKNFKAMN